MCGVGHSYVWSLLCVVLIMCVEFVVCGVGHVCGVCCVWCWS